MQYASITDQGKIRSLNEDSLFVPTKYTQPCHAFLMAVADGMGGHSAGEVASKLAIKSLLSYLEKPGMLEHAQEYPAKVLSEAIFAANEKIWMLSTGSASFSGMGSTITAAMCFQNKLVVANVGDSRAYIVTKSGIQQLTRDHTMVQEMVDKGEITKEEAAHHAQRHILMRALGVRLRERPEIFDYEWKKGDLLLLCSDGLTGAVQDQEIHDILKKYSRNIEKACQTLLALSLERGGIDNITICIAKNTDQEVQPK